MPARIVIVHDEPEFVDAVVEALQVVGLEAVGCATSMTALRLLETARTIELLVTRVVFPDPPHGVALALMARDKRPGTKVLFTAQEEYRHDTDGIGTFLQLPVTAAQVAEAARGLLGG